MWSVWSEPVDVYLGQGLAMLKVGAATTRAVEASPALPIEQVLSKLGEAASSYLNSLGKKPTRCRLWLSAALCPAIHVDLPSGVRGWREQHEVALVAAATSLGMSPTAVICELAMETPNIAAALPTALHAQLLAWAASRHWKIASLMPLWSLASLKWPAAEVLLLQEPDAVTVLMPCSASQAKAVSLIGGRSAGLDAQVRRLLVGTGYAEQNVPRTEFSTQSNAPAGRSSGPWSGHWIVP